MSILLPLLGFAAFLLILFGAFIFRKRWQKIQRQRQFNHELMAQEMGLSSALSPDPASKTSVAPQATQKKSKLSEQERLQEFLDRY